MNDLKVSNSVQAATSYPVPVVTTPAPEEKRVAPSPQSELAKVKQEAQKPPVVERPKAATDPKELKRMTEELQRRVGGANAQIQFSVDESTGISVVKVTDRMTHEVIRQIPSEEVLQIAKSVDHYKEGLLVNSKA
jgi:flagellar protein FlaG